MATVATLSALNVVTPAARAATGDVVINEIESSKGEPDDWVELYNKGTAAVDISGYVVTDNEPSKSSHRYTIPAGTKIQPGGFFTIDLGGDLFGLGKNDSVNLFGTDGKTVIDTYSWQGHSPTTLARCPNGTGDFTNSKTSTKNAANDCVTKEVIKPSVVINEVNTHTAQPGDFIELKNTGTTPADVSGFVLMDSKTRDLTIPDGSVIQPGGYLMILTDQDKDHGFGLGSEDSARLFMPDAKTLIDSYSWTAHGEPSWARCPDGSGDFKAPASITPGAANDCSTPAPVVLPDANPWPGAKDITVQDNKATFLTDSSGLDFTMEGSQGVLWGVDNKGGTFYKMLVEPDGSFQLAPGFDKGKRAVFKADADQPDAPGPDSEGITVAEDGYVYLAVERDFAAKNVNYDVIMKVDPNAAGPNVVATQEWNLTDALPQVMANMGLEAISWVPDAALAGKLWDDNTKAPYDPSKYAGHGTGLFFVAVEDKGQIFAFALNDDGTFKQVAHIQPELPGIMALDWDGSQNALWAKCDNACDNQTGLISFNATATADISYIARPDAMPADLAAEGFAVSDLAYCVNGQRPVWWFTDGVSPQSLHSGFLSCDKPAQFTISPDSWLDGDTVTVSGDGAAPGETVTLSLSAPDGSKHSVGSVVADKFGAFTWTGVLPVFGDGQYVLAASGTNYQKSLNFTRNPQPEQPDQPVQPDKPEQTQQPDQPATPDQPAEPDQAQQPEPSAALDRHTNRKVVNSATQPQNKGGRPTALPKTGAAGSLLERAARQFAEVSA